VAEYRNDSWHDTGGISAKSEPADRQQIGAVRFKTGLMVPAPVMGQSGFKSFVAFPFVLP